MLLTRVADGIAYQGGCVVRCYNHMWQMEWPLSTLILFQFKFWAVTQNLIPYVRQMVLAYDLFRDGLLTLMYRASFMVLIRTYYQKPHNGSQGQRSHPEKSGVIYRYSCDREECDEEYIGESARTFSERFKEHQKAPSPIYCHSIRSGHEVNIDSFSIVGRRTRTLLEP